MPAPIAIDDLLSASANTPIILSIADLLLANDSDPDGDPLTLASFEQPANGTLVDNGDGTLTYTPNAGFVGLDVFTYIASDGTEQSNSANVQIDVAAPGGFGSDDFSGAGLGAGWSLQGPAGTAALAAAPGESYLEIALPNGDFNAYGVNNSARVMQAAADEDFGIETKFLSAPSERFQMQGILIEQDADNWIRYDLYHDGSQFFLFSAVTVNGVSSPRFNFSVAAGSASHLRVDRSGNDWTFEYSADGTTWTTAGSYTHALAVASAGVFAGSTGGAQGYTAQVDYFYNTAAPITLEDPAPVAGDDTATTDVDTPLVFDVSADLLSNDSDPNGAPLSLTGFTQPANGTLVDNGDGTLTYTPNAGFAGGDSFTYTVSDGADSDTATVIIGVTDAANTAPTAQDDAVTTNEDTATVISALANDTDPDSDPLSIASVTQGANGTVVDNGNGTLTYTPDPDFNGADSFTYTVSDGRGGFDTATVNVTVDPVNDAPVAQDDAFSTASDIAIVLNVASDLLGNDTDPNGDPLTLASFEQPANGTLVDNGDGTLTYTPNAGFAGVDTFTYIASDGTAQSNSASVQIEVGMPGGIVSDDFSGASLGAGWSLQGPAGTAVLSASPGESFLEIALPTGDFNAYGVNNSARVMQDASNEDFGVEAKFLSAPAERFQMQGILIEQDTDNWIRYDLYHDGTQFFLFSAVTVNGVSSSRFNITVADGSASHLRVDRSGNDWTFEYSSDGVTWTTAGSYSHALTVASAGVFAGSTGGSPGYTAQVDYFYNTAAPLSVEDPVPVAGDDTATTDVDTPLVLDVSADLLANDADPNGAPLSLTGFTQPANGTLVDNGDGTLTYTPNTGFTGSDTFTYTVSDGADSDTATVTIGVADPSNSAPVAQDDTVNVNEDTATVISVLANDSDPDSDPLSVTGFSQAANGTVVDNGDGTLTYTPDADFNGSDSFTYTVTDGSGGFDTATVNVTVDPVNDAPVAQSDALATPSNTSVVINVAGDLLANDTDAEGNPLTLASFGQPANGTLVDNGNGTLTYTPNAGYVGMDSFSYTASDGTSQSNSASVQIEVGLPGGLTSDDFSGASLGSGWSLQGPAGTAVLATSPGESFLEIALPTGDFNAYGVNNSARVMQAAANEDFGVEAKFLSTPSAQFQMQGILIEQDADNWIRFDLYHDGTQFHIFSAVTVGGSSSTRFDTLVAAGSATHLKVDRSGDAWTFQYSSNGTTWTTAGSYTHALTVAAAGVFAGSTGGSPGYAAQVDYFYNTAAPLAVEDPAPVAQDDTATTDADTAVVIDVASDLLSNDADPNGAPLSLESFSQPANGTLVDNGNGTLTYTPNAGFTGTDTFTYSASDGADSDTATVTVGVTDPASTAPTAQDDAVATNEDTAAVISVLSNDSDPDSDPLTITGFSQAANGTVVDNGDGTFTYTPDADFNGADSFTYTITDGRGYFDTATVNVTVDPVNDAPVAQDDAISTPLDAAVVIDIASDLLGNDTDADGDPLTLASFAQPSNGTLVDNGDGTLTYTPDAGFIGVDVFTYTASDGTSPSGTANVQIEVGLPGSITSDDFSGASLDPGWSLQGPAGTVALASDATDSYVEIAVPSGDYDAFDVNNAARLMQAATNEDFGVEAKFLSEPTERFQIQGILIEQDANNWIRFDTVHNGSTLQIYAGVTIGGNTTGVITSAIPAGSASYLRVDRVGNDWTYQYSSDGVAWTTAGTVTQALNVTSTGVLAGNTGGAPGFTAQVDYFFNTAAPVVPEDDVPSPPVAQDDTATTAADTPVVLDVAADLLANDTDPNSDPLSLDSFGQASNGTVTDNGDGTLTYTPNAGFSGVDSFDYTISDGTGTPTDTATVFIGVDNTGPTAQNDAATTDEDVAVNVAVLGNDTDLNGDNLFVAGVSNPANGTIAINPDGTLTYTPDADFNGVDSVTYTVSDGVAQSVATVDFTINSVADAPVARNDSLSSLPGAALIINVDNDLLANDSDPDGDIISFDSFAQPANGTLVDNGDGTLTYTPNAGFEGVDTFTYTIGDGTFTSNATVDVAVTDAISVWFGDVQQFGNVGETQRWINVLGNADPEQVTSLSYSLNGGPDQALSLGPDTRRLQENGDFNIDIDFDALNGTSVDDVITIKATLTTGDVITKDVVIDYVDGNIWDPNYQVDWSTVTDLQDVTQIVDGNWAIDGDGVRTTETGYDRILAFGDKTWDNYEANFTMTVNQMLNPDPVVSGSGFGVGMLWNGHTNDPIPDLQPLTGYNPLASPFYNSKDGEFILHDHPNWSPPHLGTAPFLFTEGVTYNVQVRIEQTNVLDRTYKFKIWEDTDPEPVNWLLEGVDQMTDPVTGGFLLIAHQWDITFGDISFAEIIGNDILPGTEGDDTLVAVDTGQTNPGLAETDVFIGDLGADTFVFGDITGSFYDDGNTTTLGLDDYGLIWDFETGIDTIQLTGSYAEYAFAAPPSGLEGDTAIYRSVSGQTDELVALVRGSIDTSEGSSDFTFTDDLIA